MYTDARPTRFCAVIMSLMALYLLITSGVWTPSGFPRRRSTFTHTSPRVQLVYEADGTGVPTEACRRTATNCGLLNVSPELLAEVLGHDVVSQSVTH